MATVQKSRNRSKNFESSEIQLLTELVEQNISIINSKLTNSVTNERKKQIWESITAEINSLGVCERNIKEVKTKWANLHQSAKKEFSDRKIHLGKTGGGPCSKPVSSSIEKIVDMYSDCPTFTGLGGVESSITEQGEQNIQIIGTPKTMDLLSQVLQEQQAAVVPTTDATEPCCSSAADLPQSPNDVHLERTGTDTNVMPSLTLESDTTIPVKAIRPSVGRGKRRVTHDDVTRLQYEVLLEQKKKLVAQTTYYELINKKLRLELEL